MLLYSFFRSSAAYRVRIALSLKGIPYETAAIDLNREGGEHNLPHYRAVNPHGRVPSLQVDDGRTITQSMAILEYLEEAYPTPSLLPGDLVHRAEIRAVAQIVVADIHPLNNMSPTGYLRDRLGQGPEAIQAWYAHWISSGFRGIEALMRPGPFAFGASPSLADVCLVPQVFNARRFNVDLTPFPAIVAVDAHCATLPAFAAAHPARQPDAA